MGTTASTAQQTAVSGPPFEGLQGGMEDHHSLSIHSFQAAGPHNSRAKSIITNKVAPVVITYNCKEEFQIHDEVLKAHYTVGRISESTQEHYLVQGRYFMVRDVSGKMDVLNTTGSCGAPNFRQARGGQAVFGMGQPSLAGFQRLLQKLQGDGHKECIFFCVREEPVLFLRLDDDFVSYTPRDKQRLRENLRALSPGARPESLELAIRKEIHDFAQLGEGTYHVYHDIEHFRDEPRSVRIQSEDDIHVTEEVYKRPIFLLPSYRYHRLPLPEAGAPLEAQFDAFIGFLRESPSLLPLRDPSGTPPALVFSCQTGIGRTNLGMVLGTLVLSHCRRPVPLTFDVLCFKLPSSFVFCVLRFFPALMFCSKSSFRADIRASRDCHLIPFSSPPLQGNGGPEPQQQKTLQSLERYFYLIAFNYYLHEQYPLAFALSFSRWMCGHPELYRLQVKVNPQRVPFQVADEPFSPDVLSTAREMDVANFRRVAKSPWHGPACGGREGAPRGAGVPQGSPPPPGLGALPLPLQEEHGRGACTLGPLPSPSLWCPSAPQDFERLLQAVKEALAKEPSTGFVFSCLSGQGRTTTAMVVAVLTLWHITAFPEMGEEEIVSVPDAKYTKGEFEVVMKVVQLLPDGHRIKKEVDMALDTVSETMTPMHYHLREIIICTYRQGKTAKEEQEARTLYLRSLQYLERYIFLILFNAYLHLEKPGSWQRPFSVWMLEVAAKAGVYEILNHLGFTEFEAIEDTSLSRLRYRWRERTLSPGPFLGDFL
uniref:Phosphatase domain containing paladin 1 n=1 Tax=Sarcophilus harrisii TaxID=9305 RepID=A0A7N4NXI7_SARHA